MADPVRSLPGKTAGAVMPVKMPSRAPKPAVGKVPGKARGKGMKAMPPTAAANPKGHRSGRPVGVGHPVPTPKPRPTGHRAPAPVGKPRPVRTPAPAAKVPGKLSASMKSASPAPAMQRAVMAKQDPILRRPTPAAPKASGLKGRAGQGSMRLTG